MNNTEKRLSDIEVILRMLLKDREKPSTFRQLWNWTKLYIIPFVFGMVICGVGWQFLSSANRPQAVQQPTLEQQAALGGAVIPFPNGSPSPSPSTWLPRDSLPEPSDLPLMSISEPPLPPSPPVNNGQTNLQRSFRRAPVRTR